MNKYLERVGEFPGKRELSMVFAKHGDGWAASTRPIDKRAFPGEIGTPGGKADPGETPRETALREALEEGWRLEGLEEEPFHTYEGDTFKIHSFYAEQAYPLKKWKESHRGVMPVKATLEDLKNSHETNVPAVQKLREKGHK